MLGHEGAGVIELIGCVEIEQGDTGQVPLGDAGEGPGRRQFEDPRHAQG